MTTANLSDQILSRLVEVRVRCPELRFGQLVSTIGMLAEDETGNSLWEIEDNDFAAALDRFAADMARRGFDNAEPAPAPARSGFKAASSPTHSEPPRQVS